MKTWTFAVVGLGVVGCFGQVSDPGSGGGSTPSAPTASATEQAPPVATPATSPGESSGDPAPTPVDAGPAPSEAGCVPDAGTGACNLADGQQCQGDQDCASGVCFGNGNVAFGICSESCSAANEATVCTFGQHKCSDPDSGYCL